MGYKYPSARRFERVAKVYLFFEATWIVTYIVFMLILELWDFSCTKYDPEYYRTANIIATLHTVAPMIILYIMDHGQRAWVFFAALLTLSTDLNGVLNVSLHLNDPSCQTQFAMELVLPSFGLVLSFIALSLVAWAKFPGYHIDFTNKNNKKDPLSSY